MIALKRNISIFRIFWHQYVAVVVFFIVFLYYESMFKILLPKIQHSKEYVFAVPMAIIINILTILVVWSLIQTMITDPGRVPQYWGFFLDDPEHKKKRYCLICHIFKPERCHHCSACNRCVLNMDHHCPWINNCVGFSNRKFFLLLIIYASLEMLIVNCLYLLHFYDLYKRDQLLQFINLPFYLTFMVIFPMQGVFTNFLYFHIKMVFKNETTIENMEKIRDNLDLNAESRFSMGSYNNWVQVFGYSKLLWFLPIYGENGFPVGDGVVWQMKQVSLSSLNQQDYNDNTTNTQNHTQTQVGNGQSQNYAKIYQNLDQSLSSQSAIKPHSSRFNIESQRQKQSVTTRDQKVDTENVQYTFNTTIKNETGILLVQSNMAKLEKDFYNPNQTYGNKISANTTALIEEEQ